MGKTFSTSSKKSNNVDITNSDQKEEFKHTGKIFSSQ